MAGIISSRIVADVKCYYCGHISGQIVGRKGQPLRPTDFVPRSGYAGAEVKAGVKLRCERCRGPVFLEDATINQPMTRRPRRKTDEGVGRRTAA